MSKLLREVSLHIYDQRKTVFIYRINPRTGRNSHREYHISFWTTDKLSHVISRLVSNGRGHVVPRANGWMYFDRETD